MKKSITGKLVLLAALSVAAAFGSLAYSHCQVPCGIYGDDTRFTLIAEHITTIEKSMNQIEALSKEQHPNWNQIVRWVVNKEDHADQLTEIVTFYFLAQRVKPADPKDKAASAKYVKQLTLKSQKTGRDLKDLLFEDPEAKPYLAKLTKAQKDVLSSPEKYTGIASKKAEKVCSFWKKRLGV